ncbi:glycosyltransferase family 87 protein [Planctomycetota bacterium]|nr:glycosyltransferase family 87 protein [Planctomycetota bacterium]
MIPAAIKQNLPVVIALAMLLVQAVMMPFWWLDNSLDITVFWEAGARMMSGGGDLYAASKDPANSVGQYIYPPLFASIFAAFTAFPRWFGYLLWALCNVAMIAACLHLLAQTMRVSKAYRPWFMATVMLALFGAFWFNNSEGQVNTLVLLFLCGGVVFLERKRPLIGGIFIGGAAMLKVIPIVLVFVLLAQKRFRAAAGMGFGLLIFWTLPMVWMLPSGPIDAVTQNVALTQEYVNELAVKRAKSSSASGLGGSRAPNNSLSAVGRRYLGKPANLSTYKSDGKSPLVGEISDGVIRWTALGIGAILGLMSIFLAWRRRDSRHGRIASLGLGLTAAAMVNPLYWPHHTILLALAIAPLAAAGWRLRLIAPLAVLCYLPLMKELTPLRWMGILGTPTLGVLVIWGTVFVKSWRRSVDEDADPNILRAHEEAKRGNSTA